MTTLPGQPTSYWVDSTTDPGYAPLEGDITVDVAVVGAGVAGLTTALLCKRAGKRVAVVERTKVGTGVTGFTTAKVTALHGLIYQQLLKKHGRERTRVYAEANQSAVDVVARLVADEGIDCDFERAAAYTYGEADDQRARIEAEVEAASAVGLPVTFEETTPLPWPVAAAVRLEDQAQFHPRKYTLALAALVHGDGSTVHEDTLATGVDEGHPARLKTDRGTITAEHVVVASHYPFLDRGLFFARLSPTRSYALGVRLEGQVPPGMFLSSDQPTRSIRAAQTADGELMILGGQGHKVGHDEDTSRHYLALEQFARERFTVASIDYRWSSQDNMPADDIPYVGRYSKVSRGLYVATGFMKWGFTNGTAAAVMLSDLITGRDNPWLDAFDATRVSPLKGARKLIAANLDVAATFVGDRLPGKGAAPGSVQDLKPGEGAVVRLEGKKVAAYRDEAGALHAVSPTCTHMGCQVHWNDAERSWDCPCHGSRFGTDGAVLQGPAITPLKRRDVT